MFISQTLNFKKRQYFFSRKAKELVRWNLKKSIRIFLDDFSMKLQNMYSATINIPTAHLHFEFVMQTFRKQAKLHMILRINFQIMCIYFLNKIENKTISLFPLFSSFSLLHVKSLWVRTRISLSIQRLFWLRRFELTRKAPLYSYWLYWH